MENGCAPAVVTFDSVAIRVWPRPCEPAIPSSPKRATNSRGSIASLNISIRRPALTTCRCGRSASSRSASASSRTTTAWLEWTSASPSAAQSSSGSGE